jgi:two-component system cell cycle sensor histidine kinase/response regulator CckA
VTAPVPSQPRQTILLVEDERAVRSLAHDLLERLGYEVLCAESGEEAMAIGTERGTDITLLLSDVALPGMNGSTLAAHFTERLPGLKVVLMSGHIDPTAEQHTLATADGFVQKPFTLAKLGQVVRQVLGADGA